MPRPDKSASRPARPSGRVSPLSAHHHLLGTTLDGEIAALLGMQVKTVAAYRRRHGIAPFLIGRPSTRKKRQRPVLRPPEARAVAFEVVVRREGEDARYLVVGRDIVEAMGIAVRAIGDDGEVISITWDRAALV